MSFSLQSLFVYIILLSLPSLGSLLFRESGISSKDDLFCTSRHPESANISARDTELPYGRTNQIYIQNVKQNAF